MTYVPSQVDEIIRKYLTKIDNNTLGILIRDIEQTDEGMMGMDFDKRMWLELLKTLKNERDKRKVQP